MTGLFGSQAVVYQNGATDSLPLEAEASTLISTMRPMFTIHAGEYLVGLHVQKHLKLNAWIPAKDTGIDLLVTDPDNHHSVSLQVKYGKDFLPEEKIPELRENFRCLSWFTLNRTKLNASPAEFWVFVLHGFKSEAPDFIVIPATELQRRMAELHESGSDVLQCYLSSTESGQCWETRGLGKKDKLEIVCGTYRNPLRDFTRYMNEDGWTALKNRLLERS